MSNALVRGGFKVRLVPLRVNICDAMETTPSAVGVKGIAGLRSRGNGSGRRARICESAPRPDPLVPLPRLIHRKSVDCAAAVVALMVVPIVLIGTAKLEQVVAFQHGNVVTKHLVVPIPETAADLLVVHVKGAEILSLPTGRYPIRARHRGRRSVAELRRASMPTSSAGSYSECRWSCWW